MFPIHCLMGESFCWLSWISRLPLLSLNKLAFSFYFYFFWGVFRYSCALTCRWWMVVVGTKFNFFMLTDLLLFRVRGGGLPSSLTIVFTLMEADRIWGITYSGIWLSILLLKQQIIILEVFYHKSWIKGTTIINSTIRILFFHAFDGNLDI